MARDTIFICHATPDDNNFVRWLGARLTAHGYKVWADMFSLKGGMPFWNTIEDTLREHACKVVYVASKASVNAKRRGVRNELSVADAVRKALRDPAFIIPVRLDDVAFSDFPISSISLTRSILALCSALVLSPSRSEPRGFYGDRASPLPGGGAEVR